MWLNWLKWDTQSVMRWTASNNQLQFIKIQGPKTKYQQHLSNGLVIIALLRWIVEEPSISFILVTLKKFYFPSHINVSWFNLGREKLLFVCGEGSCFIYIYLVLFKVNQIKTFWHCAKSRYRRCWSHEKMALIQLAHHPLHMLLLSMHIMYSIKWWIGRTYQRWKSI